ncbi:MAG: biofilm PGA synthesis protein PgaB [Chlamydiales bacterium]|nr:biofilm PGA synthesis protein PgaB [Chlamydiales bacterium]
MHQISIYNGSGVSQHLLCHTLHTCQKLWPDAQVTRITAKSILQKNGLTFTDLLIFPGGADIPYKNSLNGKGNENIRTFIESGKIVLGICAGSYYLSDEVQFALGTSIAVHEKRELKFFSGIARGPHIPPFDYQSLNGVKAVTVYCKGHKPLSLYYNGGGSFLNASTYPNTKVIATYDDQGQNAAIIECQVGKGKAILSALHIEYDPIDMPHPDLKPINRKLKMDDEGRLALFRSLLS